MKNALPSSVYVFKAESGVKVGRSRDPAMRLKQVQAASSSLLELRYSTSIREDASLVEALAHKALNDRRISGEWFAVAAEEAVAAVENAVAECDLRPQPTPRRRRVMSPRGRGMIPVVFRVPVSMAAKIAELSAERTDGADRSAIIRELLVKALSS